MGLCIGIRENQLRDAVEILGTDKFKYKFLYDTSNQEEFHEELGISKLRDVMTFSGCTNYFRNARLKTSGAETYENWARMVSQVFMDDRQLAIVNDFFDNPNMVLVFTNKYKDPSAQRGNTGMTFNDDIMDKIIEIFLNNLDLQEGMNVTTLDIYKTGIIKDNDVNNEDFKRRQEKIKEKNKDKYKQQLIKHFEESFKFRLITYYTKLREFNLDEIMRKLDDLGYLDERFKRDDVYIYEEEARRLLARRLCTLSYKNDIEILMNQGIMDRDRITYDIGI